MLPKDRPQRLVCATNSMRRTVSITADTVRQQARDILRREATRLGRLRQVLGDMPPKA